MHHKFYFEKILSHIQSDRYLHQWKFIQYRHYSIH